MQRNLVETAAPVWLPNSRSTTGGVAACLLLFWQDGAQNLGRQTNLIVLAGTKALLMQNSTYADFCYQVV